MKRNRRISDREGVAGFTLLEVMIAVAILAVTLSVLYGSQTQSLSLATEAKFNTEATFLSALKMAELEAGVIDFNEDEGEFEEQPGYRWKVEIEEATFEEPEALRDMEDVVIQRVMLSISWADYPFTHRITTYLIDKNEP